MPVDRDFEINSSTLRCDASNVEGPPKRFIVRNLDAFLFFFAKETRGTVPEWPILSKKTLNIDFETEANY